jgi:predicted CXXCH cytochrome family protein
MSSHRSSNATWNGASPNPWPHTSYNDVSANGCENCHRPHTAGSGERLLNYEVEEDNCFPCHNGNVAKKNIKKEFFKPYRHPIQTNRKIHKPDEGPVWSPRHVECTDCHNPHAANASPAKPPVAVGSLAQLTGVSSSGTIVKPLGFEYELCYRCHGDNPGGKSPVVTRQIFEKNLRRKFNPSNASYHPIEASGKNRDVPSLIIPYTTSSLISCTDCHNSDSGNNTGTAPRGPHGSIWEPILERQLITTDSNTESSMAYALCYKCHNRNSILSGQSFPEHKNHIVDQRAPCTACHDSHGVDMNTHLINFDKTIVFQNDSGLISFDDKGRYQGSCSLKCHNENHDQRAYPQSKSIPAQKKRSKIRRSIN